MISPALWIIMFIFALTTSIISLGSLMRYTLEPPVDLQSNVLFSSFNLVVFMFYYFTLETFRQCFFRKRRRRTGGEYNDLQHAETEFQKGRPRLHMNDVWVLVYGVGICYYVINYVFTCLDLLSMQFIGYGIFLLIIQEVASSGKSVLHGDNVLYLMGACFMFVAMIIKGSDKGYEHVAVPFQKSDLWTISYGIILPFCTIVIFLNIKIDNKYTFGDFYELCEFGFPFAYIMAVTTTLMWKLYNCTKDVYGLFLSAHLPVTLCVTPFPMLVIIVLCMEAVLKNHVLDVFISLCMASSILDLAKDSQNQLAVVSIILTWIGLIIRMSLFLRKKQPQKNETRRELQEPPAVHVIDDENLDIEDLGA